MDAKLLARYRSRPAAPVFLHELPKPRTKRPDFLTAACVGLALASVAALAVTIIPIIT